MKKTLNNDKITLIPVILSSTIIPMVVYLKKVILPLNIQELFGGIEYAPDFFSYYKSNIMIASGFIAMLIIAYSLFIGKKIKTGKMDYLIFTYIGLIIVSILFSGDVDTSLFGFYNLYEGGLVLISYGLLFFYTRNFIERNSFKVILSLLLLSGCIICLIGVFQFIGLDPLVSKFMSKILVSAQDIDFANKLMTNSNKYIMYGTLSNSNYLGSYTAILLPISIIVSLSEETKLRYLYKIITILIFVNLIGSQSRAGLLGTGLGLLLLIILSKEFIKLKFKEFSVLILIFVVAVLLMFMLPSGNLTEKYKTIKESDIGNLERVKPVEKIEYVEDGVFIAAKGNVLKVLLEKDSIIFKDGNNSELNIVKLEDGMLKFSDPEFNEYNLEFIPENNLVLLSIDETIFRLAGINGKGVRLLNYKGEVIESLFVKEYNISEKFASSRGYIWSRTVPLIKDNIFIGKGPDNFVYEFPQDDLDGKYRVYGDDTILVNKPHNMYLQIAINTGLLSLIIFLIMVFISLYRGLLSNDLIIIAISSGIFGYLIVAIFNDSVVSVSPVFWILLGLINVNNENCL